MSEKKEEDLIEIPELELELIDLEEPIDEEERKYKEYLKTGLQWN